MSKLIVEVCKIEKIENHNRADLLELAIIKGWKCIVEKNKYKVGDKIIYIPPDSVIPIDLIETLGVKNYLSGPNKNKVKSIKLRGEMSFGLIIELPKNKNWKIGYDCSKDLGITKYIPPIRTNVGNAAPEDPLFDKFSDIENIRNYPNIFKDKETVIITEKIDGSNSRTSITIHKTFLSKLFPFFFSSKIELKAGSHKVKRQKPPKDEISTNTYWYPLSLQPVKDLLFSLNSSYNNVILYGEIYGKIRGGHKSMHYGRPEKLSYIAFSIKADGQYMNYEDFKNICDNFKVPIVPFIAKMPFNFEKIKKLSKGNSLLAEKNGTKHIREGIVIVSEKERKEKDIKRAILKMINDDYLIMKEKKANKGEIVDYTDN